MRICLNSCACISGDEKEELLNFDWACCGCAICNSRDGDGGDEE